MQQYPPEQYGKLYPISAVDITRKIGRLMFISQLVMAIGVVIIVHGIWTQSSEMLGWDSQSVITIFYMMQIAPLVMLAVFSERYFKRMRALNQDVIRRASLTPRKLSNYAPNWLIGIALATYLFFVGLVIFIAQHPFDGFAGYVNILGVTGLNVFFGFIIYKAVYGKKKDPHQTDDDRFKQSSRIAKLMLFGSIAATINISMHFLLSTLDLRHLNDVVSSIYYQVLMLVVISAVVKEDMNFDVYKNIDEAKGEV